MTIELGAMLFRAAFWIYLAAALFYFIYMINKNEGMGKAATLFTFLGVIAQTVSLVVRTEAAQRPPFLNLYEYVLSVTWGFAVVYLIVEKVAKNKSLGAFIVPLLAIVAFLSSHMLTTDVNPTMPALMSSWRVPHIATAVFAYAAFAIAFGLAIMYLIKERAGENTKSFWSTRLMPLESLDRLMYRVTAFGFMMQTALLIFGAMWAQFAWGRPWGWDPKETWGLITWLIYAAYLHTRLTMGWKGKKSAVTLIVGFLAVIITLIGVNFMGGLHSYGASR